MMLRPHGLRTACTLALGAFLSVATNAQTPAQQPAGPPPGSTVLNTGTQLVVVDVVVEDSQGKPVKGLRREDFTLAEGKTTQTIRTFESHFAGQPAKPVMTMPKMPPGNFTNYTPVPPEGALNVLLLDTLNTPMKDQSYVRNQLQQYVKKVAPGTRIAIFGLSSRLYLLQGFTSDPEVFKDAVEHKLLPRASNLLDDPVSGFSTTDSLSSMISDATIASNVAQFEAETASFQSQMRSQYTLDAFNDIAHYLSNFAGRKNLIWFSGSFPINLQPDPDLNDPFSVMYSNDEEFQETTNLLGRAQVAVYPIDARGLMTNPALSAANSGSALVKGGPAAMTKAVRSFETSQANEHSTMDRMAEATGGHAFYNTNGLAEAVALALNSGANYYTLTYDPSNQNWDGNYRHIKVALNGQFAAAQFKLTYRRGYYANDPNSKKKEPAAATVAAADTTAAHAAEAYRRNVAYHGAPLPEDILFKVRAIPASATPEDALAPNNQPDPAKPIKGPFRRYAIDYVALPTDFQLTPNAQGIHSGAIEFSAYLYSPEGVLLNAVGNTIQLNLPPNEYALFRKTPVRYHLEISAPVKGETFLRIVLHDVPANHFGAVEVPVAAISNLPPVPAPTTPSSTPTTPPATPQH
jgi:VWFA-related protein